MKKITWLVLTIILATNILVGCQKTPEEPIVVGKNSQKMLEAAQKDNTKQQGNDTKSVNLYDRLSAPPTYKAELTSKKGKLSVYANAQIILPSSELPIVRVKPVEFTIEQVKQFTKALMGSNAKFVEFDKDKQTRAAYERKIENLRAGITNWEEIVGQYVFDMQYNSKEEAECALSELLIKVASAPDSLPAITPNFIWSKPAVITQAGEIEHNNTFFMLWSMPDDATYSLLNVDNSREFAGSADIKYIRDFALTMSDLNSYEISDIASKISISQADAYALAEATIKSMGLNSFTCSAQQGVLYDGSFNEKFPAYLFMFTRQINNIPETYTSADRTIDSYNTTWTYEKAYILIDEKGVLRVEYYNPNDVLETVMSETELLPFSQIQSIFEKMVVIVNNEVDDNPMWSASGKMEYHITSVRLGLISIREQNKDTGLLVPAWDFMGYTQGRMLSSQQWAKAHANGLKSYLTINAIDGSIIERDY